METLTCPFCGYEVASDYDIMHHLESRHPEGESPFLVREKNSQNVELLETQAYFSACEQDLDFVECPREGCGDTVLLSELVSHMEMHDVEGNRTEVSYCRDPYLSRKSKSPKPKSKPGSDAKLLRPSRSLMDEECPDVQSSGLQASARLKWKELPKKSTSKGKPEKLNVPQKASRRLGEAELGPYAHEKQMPQWLRKLLETDGQVQTTEGLLKCGRPSKANSVGNHVAGVIPVITRLLHQDISIEYAYTCHPCVKHVTKLQKEGGFCGYRNIQMMISYIIATRFQGFHHFQGRTPTILEIQDFIENAWDSGINSQCRIETGGIRGTRKYIGTPEAQAMLISLGISCNAQGLKGKGNSYADEHLLRYVEEYFSSGCITKERIRTTSLPPLYLQYPGHSITIIGLEKKKDGRINLLVFDPKSRDSKDVIKLIGHSFKSENPSKLLRAYRRKVEYLRKHHQFEILSITPPQSALEVIEG